MTLLQRYLMGVLYAIWLVMVVLCLTFDYLTPPVQVAIGVGGAWIIVSILLTGWSEK